MMSYFNLSIQSWAKRFKEGGERDFAILGYYSFVALQIISLLIAGFISSTF